jgi:hypothetical protein
MVLLEAHNGQVLEGEPGESVGKQRRDIYDFSQLQFVSQTTILLAKKYTNDRKLLQNQRRDN